MDDELEVVDAVETGIGMICLRRRRAAMPPHDVVTEITLDHQFLMSSEATASERALADRAIAWHGGNGLRVLVGGLGLGYTAHAALASPRVAQVEVVELLAPVIDWHRRGLVPLAASLAAEDRLAICEGNVFAKLLSGWEHCFDVILIDVDHSPEERLGASNAAFYTADGLAVVKENLPPGCVLAVWSYAESSPFAEALRETFAEVRVERVAFENRAIGVFEMNWLFLARD
jgi:spermidine synthase